MKQGLWTCAVAIACLTMRFAAAAGDENPHSELRDPIRAYIPGRWYEQVAQDYLKEKNYPAALDAFQKAAYWANKTAQYNIGIMYTKGVDGLPVDKVRGVAWLGIADEQHEPDVDRALQEAYAVLTPEQHTAASALFKQLNADYGDAVTQPRATKRFNAQLASERGASATTETDTYAQTAQIDGYSPEPTIGNGALINNINSTGHLNQGASVAANVASMKQQFADYITVQFGHVDVGPIEPGPAPVSR